MELIALFIGIIFLGIFIEGVSGGFKTFSRWEKIGFWASIVLIIFTILGFI